MALSGAATPDRAWRQPQAHLAGLFSPVATAAGPMFKVRVTPMEATASGEGFDDAPLSQARAKLLIRRRAADGSSLGGLIAGDRLQVEAREPSLSDTWELIHVPRPVRGRTRTICYEVEAERLSLLYRYEAQLTEMGGGVVVDAAVPVALYPAADERTEGTGVSVDWSGQAPYEYLPELRANRWLVVPALGKRLHIVQAVAHRTIPRVALRLREARSM